MGSTIVWRTKHKIKIFCSTQYGVRVVISLALMYLYLHWMNIEAIEECKILMKS